MTINNKQLEFGLDTFGDLAFDDQSHQRISYSQSLRNIIAEGKLADEVGVDILALGEHHREEYAISSPDTVLAALAMVTKRIKLGTGVTVLSSDDPVRVYERFATVDALSNGRAQIMLGRGSFTESFPLFGYDLQDYEELFEEKVAMFYELLKGEPLTWKGKFTQSLENAEVYPKPEGTLDTYIGVGGTPESIIRAVRYGFPVMLAIIGGEPARFAPYVQLYQKAAQQMGRPILPVGMHSHGVIAETDEEAYEIGWHYIKKSMDKIGEDRGWPEMSKERFDFEVEHGSYYVGSPETVAQKIARTMPQVGVERFDLVYGTGGQLQKDRLRTIELYGTKVIPRVKELLRSGGK
ncbi:LLM class flavin-dependent oxidoreductase [Enterococcus gallinarum]|uniref:LLM class flavin-dependent oxidoreductase n=1 Tax=Enterococcus gallinarum TaxID=1353 RepID=UPI001AD61CE7|nr:LLM class flavin-dependent oxidoreductase [Enterococcus gallinarum]MBO6419053.1 LLM class flavin-dependent oxidoreductase [Enterococcus gallinarum]MBO6420402.1 LLM class flavin-dependent oxidoreductase [Enterococcus gallinarum]